MCIRDRSLSLAFSLASLSSPHKQHLCLPSLSLLFYSSVPVPASLALPSGVRAVSSPSDVLRGSRGAASSGGSRQSGS
eukprot:3232049-Rhodomonas_salina.1